MLGHEKNILNEKELEGVSGGKSASGRAASNSQTKDLPTERHFCKKCDTTRDFIVYSGTRSVCSVCSTPFTFGN